MPTTTIISGLDFLGRGVDLLELDAFDVANSCKTVQLILTTKDETYEKEGYTIPSGVEAFLQPQTTIEGGETLMSNSYDFQRELSKSIEANAGVEGIFEFSASRTFKTTSRETASREDVFTYLIAHHSLCVATLDLFGVQAKYLQLNANFKNAVKKLPVTADRAAYRELIKAFGTHFLSTVTLGGMAYSKVSTKAANVGSSSSVEESFKTDARFTIKKVEAGTKSTSGSTENRTRDEKNKITRSSIAYVGGQGNPEQIDSVWIESLKEMSVPVIATKQKKDNFVLRRVSVLLDPQFFDGEDGKELAARRKLLDEETSRYITERGGDECGRIRYGQPVKLTAVGTNRRLYYCPNRANGRGPALYDRIPDEPLEAGSAEAAFEVHRAGRTTGDDVLAGDSLVLELKNAKAYLTIENFIPKAGPWKGKLTSKLSLMPQPVRVEGEYSLRLRGSKQPTDGAEMEEKRRPLVSGDIVMVSRYDGDVKKFVIVSTPLGLPFGGVMTSSRDRDELLSPTSSDGRGYFVIRNG